MSLSIYSSKKYALASQTDGYLFKRLLKFLNPKKEDKILEIGCGRGIFTKKINAFCKNLIGVDINEKAVSNGLVPNLKVMDATNLDFPSDHFDKIYSCHTIEHIPDIKKVFLEMERVLKPGGKIILVYPFEMIRGLGATGAALIIFKNPFLGRKIHIHKLNPEKIKKIIKGSKLEHIESRFLFFNTFQFITALKKKS